MGCRLSPAPSPHQKFARLCLEVNHPGLFQADRGLRSEFLTRVGERISYHHRQNQTQQGDRMSF